MNTIVESINKSWQKSWLKWVFSYTALAKYFEQFSSTGLGDTPSFVQAYLSSNWFVRWWFRGFVKDDDLKSFDDTIKANRNEDTFKVIEDHPQKHQELAHTELNKARKDLIMPVFGPQAKHEFEPAGVAVMYKPKNPDDGMVINLTGCQKKIQISSQYHHYLSQILQDSSRFSFFSLNNGRHDNAQSQHEYDKRFGLTVVNQP